MKFRIQVSHNKCDPWWEEYDKNITDPQAWADKTIAWFNDTRSKKEPKRKLLAVELIDETSRKEHTWKKTNVFTIMNRGGCSYDTYRCTECGITAKRFGIGGSPVLNSRYARAKVFLRCDTSKNHLEALGKCKLGKKRSE